MHSNIVEKRQDFPSIMILSTSTIEKVNFLKIFIKTPSKMRHERVIAMKRWNSKLSSKKISFWFDSGFFLTLLSAMCVGLFLFLTLLFSLFYTLLSAVCGTLVIGAGRWDWPIGAEQVLLLTKNSPADFPHKQQTQEFHISWFSPNCKKNYAIVFGIACVSFGWGADRDSCTGGGKIA